MRTDDFDYSLPPELIAQHPLPDRSDSRLLALDRRTHTITSTRFNFIEEFLRPGDVIVVNNSRVLPARLAAQKLHGGGAIELLLLSPEPDATWWTLLRPGKRVRPGTELIFPPSHPSVTATVLHKEPDGRCRVSFPAGVDVVRLAEEIGTIPLPPYIHREHDEAEDRERYQTVYAQHPGSVAAPTAGLHFTTALLDRLRQRGVGLAEVTLHVGLGTFSPVKAENVSEHVMHEERFRLEPGTVAQIEQARSTGHRVLAVGTTSLRVLESVARQHDGRLVPCAGVTRLFVHPPARFHVVDALLTNFHLPRSTLLMLVSAFAAPESLAGREWVLAAYRQAIAERFRFFSYGDAMLIA